MANTYSLTPREVAECIDLLRAQEHTHAKHWPPAVRDLHRGCVRAFESQAHHPEELKLTNEQALRVRGVLSRHLGQMRSNSGMIASFSTLLHALGGTEPPAPVKYRRK